MSQIKNIIVIQFAIILITISITKINIIAPMILLVQLNFKNIFQKKLNVFIDVIEIIFINLNVRIINVALIAQKEQNQKNKKNGVMI